VPKLPKRSLVFICLHGEADDAKSDAASIWPPISAANSNLSLLLRSLVSIELNEKNCLSFKCSRLYF
jgi:hypothetical protein